MQDFFLKSHLALRNRIVSAAVSPVRLSWKVLGLPLRRINDSAYHITGSLLEIRRLTCHYERKQLREDIQKLVPLNDWATEESIRKLADYLAAYANVNTTTLNYLDVKDTLEKKAKYNTQIGKTVKELIDEGKLSPEVLSETVVLEDSVLAKKLKENITEQASSLIKSDSDDENKDENKKKHTDVLFTAAHRYATETQRIYPVVWDSYLKGGNAARLFTGVFVLVVAIATVVVASVLSHGALPAAAAVAIPVVSALSTYIGGLVTNIITGSARVKGGVRSESAKLIKEINLKKQQEKEKNNKGKAQEASAAPTQPLGDGRKQGKKSSKKKTIFNFPKSEQSTDSELRRQRAKANSTKPEINSDLSEPEQSTDSELRRQRAKANSTKPEINSDLSESEQSTKFTKQELSRRDNKDQRSFSLQSTKFTKQELSRRDNKDQRSFYFP